MKKSKLFSGLALLSLALVACNKEEPINGGG